jgi:hypothetical protein
MAEHARRLRAVLNPQQTLVHSVRWASRSPSLLSKATQQGRIKAMAPGGGHPSPPSELSNP